MKLRQRLEGCSHKPRGARKDPPLEPLGRVQALLPTP